MTTETSAEIRIRQLEDRAAIQDIAILYGFVMDERDEEGIRRLFCDDATMRSQDGVFAATGMDEIVTTFLGRFAVLGPTNHFTHGHVVRFDDDDPDLATGLLSSHGEVTRNGVAMLVALRYKDTYRRVDGQWRFADRLMSYMYYLPVSEHADFGEADSMRCYEERQHADWPEALYSGEGASWLRAYL